MLSIFNQLIHIGTGSDNSFEDRRTLIINITALMGMSASFFYNIFYGFNGLWAAVLSNTLMVFGYCCVILLNYYQKNHLSGLLLLLIGTIQMFVLSIILFGSEAGVHAYFFVVLALAFLVVSKKDSLLVGSLAIITGGLFIFAEYSTWKSPFLLPLTSDVIDILHVSSIAGSISIITVIIVTFYISLNKAQEALEMEHQRAENLLLNILPSSIAQQLKAEHAVIAHDFDEVTILFADIVGFTTFSETLPPKRLVELLNKIFSLFDHLVEKHQIEKIKTIGDAYMVAGGLPLPKKGAVEAMADFALDMQKVLKQFNKENNQTFDIRVGIHTGSVVAGVIGTKKFAYDVWGDTVNTASRMESHGVSGQIQVSEPTYNYLKYKYIFQKRGSINVKGKGAMKTYLLQENKG